jgi:glycogen synthase
MRLAVFSNLFPPLWLGGYEVGAARVVRELRRRGHEVLVLTARQALIWRGGRFVQQNHPATDSGKLVDVGPCVMGSLAALGRREPWRLPFLLTNTLRARVRYRSALAGFAPDLVLLFNPLGVLAPVAADCLAWGRRRQIPVRAYVSDSWQSEWPLAHPLWRLLPFLAGIAQPVPRSEPNLFCSRFLREKCGSPEDRVIPWGVPDMDQRGSLPARHFEGQKPLTLLFAGQIEPHKGLTLLLKALAQCRRPHRLVILGDDRTDHAPICRQLTFDLGLGQRVIFMGKQPPDAIAGLLPRLGHVLITPSLWQEPLSLTVLEGMAAGLPVVASRTGGTPEAITDERTGFLFNPERSKELTQVLDRLEEDRGLCYRVGMAAQEEVRHRFTMETMVDLLEG